jgi:hypothetical protein
MPSPAIERNPKNRERIGQLSQPMMAIHLIAIQTFAITSLALQMPAARLTPLQPPVAEPFAAKNHSPEAGSSA